jgi:flavin-dependent dehydrogenase
MCINIRYLIHILDVFKFLVFWFYCLRRENMAAKKVHIVGAGLSGMVAAYNLATEGHEVLVLDKGKSFGGDLPHHPSNHYTPISIDWIWDYIGIDLSSCFHASTGGNYFIGDEKFTMPVKGYYLVERGARKGAVDSLLYDKCLEAGVKFEFGHDITDPLDMPDPTILATGLHKEMGHILSRPMLRLPCFVARKKLDSDIRDGHTYCWVGDYTNTYGYASIINNLDYFLLFSDTHLTYNDLKKYEEHLEASLGLKFEKWDYFEVWVPLAGLEEPTLFSGSKILAGTLAGMMDPGFYFGIHGAMLSGKVAAMAVTDPELAYSEIKRLHPNYKAGRKGRKMAKYLPMNAITRMAFRFPPMMLAMAALAKPSIPGYFPKVGDIDKPKYLGKI